MVLEDIKNQTLTARANLVNAIRSKGVEIADDSTINQCATAITMIQNTGSSGDAYVAVEENGELKLQKLSFNGNEATPDGATEAMLEVGLFPTGMDEPAYAGSGGGGSAMKFYKCASVDTTINTWMGYELLYNEAGYYELASDVTAGLEYSGMTPVIGSVYSADTKLQINIYYTNPNSIPTQGLVMHVSLTEDKATAETGQTITKNGEPTYQVIDGIPCVYVNHYYNSLTISSEGVPAGDSPTTWSLWAKEISYTGGESDGHLISLKGPTIDGIDYVQGICFNGKSSGKLGAGVYGGDNDPWAYADDSLDSEWHHIVMTRDAEGLYCLYLDGVKKAEKALPETSYASNGGFLALGYLAYYHQWGASGYVSNIRIYNRALSQDEITALASEFTPTTA